VEVWREGGTLLSCEPELPPRQPPWVQSLIEAMSVSGAMLLAAVALLVWMRMAVALRPRWRREKELNEHRKRGVPCGGPASIVVTDIEAYSGEARHCGADLCVLVLKRGGRLLSAAPIMSNHKRPVASAHYQFLVLCVAFAAELMAANAPLTTKALGMHNAILRRAASAHAGHVIEQEGDSWSVAFHTAMDAVAFCLQVRTCIRLQRLHGCCIMCCEVRKAAAWLATKDAAAICLQMLAAGRGERGQRHSWRTVVQLQAIVHYCVGAN
jgi:hypothetical protein